MDQSLPTPPLPPTSRPLIKRIFFSSPEPRLRAGWRLLLQQVLMLALLIGLVLLAGFLDRQKLIPGGLMFLVEQSVSLIAISLSVFLARRLFDRRSFPSLGLQLDRRALPDILVGVAIAGLMFVLIYFLEYFLGWVSFGGFAWKTHTPAQVWSGVLSMLAVFIVVGWQEELQYRGYTLQNLSEGLNMTWGVVLSSIIFGAMHLGNPSASWMTVVGITAAGLVLAFAYLTTRQLWLPMGLHLGWNYFEGVVFGFPVSGLDTFRLITTQTQGPELMTGGAFGPEAGLILLPGLALAVTLIYLYTRGRLAPQPGTPSDQA